MGVGGAGGGLVEFGERKRRPQFETLRLLSLRDRDGGEEGLFGRRWVRRIALQQDPAPDAMEQGVGPVQACPIRERQSFVDQLQGPIRVIPLGFELGEQALEDRHEQLVSLAEIRRQRFPESRHSTFAISEPGPRPIRVGFSKREKHGHSVFPA